MNYALYVIAAIHAAQGLHTLYKGARGEKQDAPVAVGTLVAAFTEAAICVVLVLAALRLS